MENTPSLLWRTITVHLWLECKKESKIGQLGEDEDLFTFTSLKHTAYCTIFLSSQPFCYITDPSYLVFTSSKALGTKPFSNAFVWLNCGLSSHSHTLSENVFFFFFIFFYFWESTAGEGQRERERGSEVGSARTAVSLIWGLNSETVRRWPEPKSDAQSTEPPRCPQKTYSVSHPSSPLWVACRFKPWL